MTDFVWNVLYAEYMYWVDERIIVYHTYKGGRTYSTFFWQKERLRRECREDRIEDETSLLTYLFKISNDLIIKALMSILSLSSLITSSLDNKVTLPSTIEWKRIVNIIIHIHTTFYMMTNLLHWEEVSLLILFLEVIPRPSWRKGGREKRMYSSWSAPCLYSVCREQKKN